MIRNALLLVTAFLMMNSCASVNMKKASPAEYGFGVQMTPGWQIGESNTSVHALASYTRLGFDGGHDNMCQYGGQVRHFVSRKEEGGIWLGGEAAFVSFTSVYDEELYFEENPSANGFAMGALAGYQFPVGKLPVSGYAGLGFVNFGDFETDGFVFDEGGTGFTAKLGVCLHLLSLFHEKGR